MSNETVYIQSLNDEEFIQRVLHFQTVGSQLYVFNLGDAVKRQLFKQHLSTLEGYDELKKVLL